MRNSCVIQTQKLKKPPGPRGRGLDCRKVRDWVPVSSLCREMLNILSAYRAIRWTTKLNFSEVYKLIKTDAFVELWAKPQARRIQPVAGQAYPRGRPDIREGARCCAAASNRTYSTRKPQYYGIIGKISFTGFWLSLNF